VSYLVAVRHGIELRFRASLGLLARLHAMHLCVHLPGSKMEKLCEAVHISLNKNAIVGDKSAAVPGGVRLGTPAMTTRGLGESDFEEVAELLHQASRP
jgi:glycine/serine hydroxymethyltransferase